MCRSTDLLSESTKGKLSIFCQVELKHVLSVHDVSNIYHVPLILVKQNIHSILKNLLGLETMADVPNLASWEKIARTVDNFPRKVPIALVGKYNGLSDSYLSVLKSLMHSGIHLNVEVDVQWIDAASLEEVTKTEKPEEYAAAWAVLKGVAGVVVPGGFGTRGVEGKIAAAKYCRESGKPYLGVCLGMQVMVIEWCRSVMGLAGANSTEFDEHTKHPAVVFMPEINPDIMGGTMRLGSRETIVSLKHKNGATSLGAQVYGLEVEAEGRVAERHRHRYEVNPQLVASIESSGLFFSGKDETGTRMEIAELPTTQHPYFLGVQFHPEFKSRPNRPSPPFFGLVAVAAGRASEMCNAGALWRTGVSARPPMSPREASQSSVSLPSSPTPYRKRPAAAISSTQTSPARVDASQDRSVGVSPSAPVQPAGKCAAIAPFKGL